MLYFEKVGRMDKKYDVIMVDAYQDITIPFQMSSVDQNYSGGMGLHHAVWNTSLENPVG